MSKFRDKIKKLDRYFVIRNAKADMFDELAALCERSQELTRRLAARDNVDMVCELYADLRKALAKAREL